MAPGRSTRTFTLRQLLVLGVVGAVIAEQVVARSIVFDGLEDLAKVADVEVGFSAGIGSQSGESLARVLTGLHLAEDGGTRKHSGAAGAAGAGIAAGDLGHEAARVHGVEGDVGAVGGVGGGAELRAVFFAGLRDAAGELNDGLAARDVAEQVGESLEGGELAVGIEDVELGLVGGEGGTVVLGDGVIGRGRKVGELGILTGDEAGHGLFEEVAIVGEVGEDLQLVAEGDHADQVGRRHLLAEELARRVGRAEQVFGLERGHIEEEDDHAAVAHGLANLFPLGDGAQGHDEGGGVIGIAGGLDPFDIVVVEVRDGLELAVFSEVELRLLETLDGLAVFVEHLNINLDQVGEGADDTFALGQRGVGRRRRSFAGVHLLWRLLGRRGILRRQHGREKRTDREDGKSASH